MIERYERTDLDGGPVVLSETIPGVRSVSLGVWVRSGSVNETQEEMGASHLLEHMVFKGTRRRSPLEIALALERLGGSLDAYTTREHTSYQARVLDDHLDVALDVLADLAVEPLLREQDLELEREVVLEEISTVEDTPDDLIFDLHAELVWGDHPYGYNILGTRETVGRISADQLRGRHAREYRRSNLVVAAAGNVEHGHFVEEVAARFGSAPEGPANGPVHAPLDGQPRSDRMQRSTAQSHIVFGSRTFGHGDPRRYALVLLTTAFGGGMSSRLFQRVREELGLAYAIYSYQSFYRFAGVSGIYVGTRPEWADRAESVLGDELEALARDGLNTNELEDAKGQVMGQVVLSLESTSARLHRLVATALFDEPFRTVDEVMQSVDAVTLDDVHAIARDYFSPDRQTVLRLGPS